jgi:hypothetical protein
VSLGNVTRALLALLSQDSLRKYTRDLMIGSERAILVVKVYSRGKKWL